MNKFATICRYALLPVFLMIAVTVALGQNADVQVEIQQLDTQTQVTQNDLKGVYQKSFDEIIDNLAQLETDLSKLTVVYSPYQYNMLLSEVWRSTGSAASVLSQLPTSYTDFSPLTRYLTQAGDFCRQLMKKVSLGTPVTAEDIDQIAKLHASCVEVNNIFNEAIATGALPDFSASGFDYYGDGTAALSFKEDEGEDKYPHLIYDGPFSESTENAQPLGLGSEPCNQQEAMAIATAFMGELSTGLNSTYDEDGIISAYGFEGKTPDGRDFQIYITKTGGHVLWMRVYAEHYDDKPSNERNDELASLGAKFLADKGMGSFEATYAQYYGGYALINYALVEDGVMIYSDLVKLWLDLTTGEVVGLDARNYLSAHRERDIGQPAISAQDAQDSIAPWLSIHSAKLALIPITIADERLCYEFKCTYGGNEFIIYVNANSGIEEEIYRLISNTNGQLVL